MAYEQNEKRNFIPLYSKYLKQFKLLSLEQAGSLTLALLHYADSGAIPDFANDCSLQMAFSFIVNDADTAYSVSKSKRQNGGKARAADGKRDESGRFLPKNKKSIQHCPAISSKPANLNQSHLSLSNLRDISKDISSSSSSSTEEERDDEEDVIERIIKQCTRLVCKPPKSARDDIAGWLNHGYTEKMIVDALFETIEYNGHSWAYVKRVVETLQDGR